MGWADKKWMAKGGNGPARWAKQNAPGGWAGVVVYDRHVTGGVGCAAGPIMRTRTRKKQKHNNKKQLMNRFRFLMVQIR